jgi:hypothetical protein
MSKVVKIVKASVATYTDKDGKVKHRYRKIGDVIETNSGWMLAIDSVPFNWTGKAFLNDPKPAGDKTEDFYDDIDF